MNSILLVSVSRIIEFIHNGPHTGRVLNSGHKCLTTVCVVIMPRADCTFKFHQWVPVVIIQQNRFSRPAYNTKVCVPSACCNNAKSGLHIWILPVSDSGDHTEREFQDQPTTQKCVSQVPVAIMPRADCTYWFYWYEIQWRKLGNRTWA